MFSDSLSINLKIYIMKKDNQYDAGTKLAVKATLHREHPNGSYVYSLVKPSDEVKELLDDLASKKVLKFRHKETNAQGDEVYVFYKREYLCTKEQTIDMTMTFKGDRLGFWVATSKVESKVDTLTGVVTRSSDDRVANALAQEGAKHILSLIGFANAPTAPAPAPAAQAPAQEQPASEDANMEPK